MGEVQVLLLVMVFGMSTFAGMTNKIISKGHKKNLRTKITCIANFSA